MESASTDTNVVARPPTVVAASDSPTVIHATGLSKRFGSVEALAGLDLSVPQHSIVGFLGPNGAGKTTAIKLLLGLSRPTSGQATVFGLDAVRDSTAIRSRVGYLAQDPRFYTHLTARETLEFTARFFFRGPKSAIQDRIEETLELVGLSEKADRPTKGFSGGERQRLGIAQAQVNHPDLLVLDEPAAALDPLGRRDVLKIMERLREHATIFYSTHILDDVQRVSDHVVILHQGRKVADATTSELLDGGCTYQIDIRGNGSKAKAALDVQPWVNEVVLSASDGGDRMTVTVSDQRAGDAMLLRSLLRDEALTVTSFGRKQHNLEEVFLHLVEGQET
ncbi:MAG TPA: ABC transporter ATP-binding protein [Acidimicrobiia bacterium]|nr:ABC transporter ATP-binding protein [Acidimicrobiia bacterium]